MAKRKASRRKTPKTSEAASPLGLKKVLDRELLRALAGTRSYERGQSYFETGCVERLALEGDTLTAIVQGTQRYRVELRPGEEAIEYACNCPYAREGAFCKHCVAAGLAFLADGAPHRPSPLSLDEVRTRLEGLEHQALVSLLLDQASADERVLERLRLAFATAPDRVELASFRRAIERAIDPGGFVPYHDAYDWSCGVDEVIDSLQRLLDAGHASAAIELSEHALAVLAEFSGMVDDSDGHVSVLCDRLERLHLAACKCGRPDPEQLAERLLRWRLESDLEVFFDAAETYADVLGESGLARYTELAREEWKQVPARGLDDRADHPAGFRFALDSHAESDYGRRFRIRHVMESLARASGDVDELVDVLRRDLSSSYGYLRIAEAYGAVGRQDDAIEWAERGTDAFSGRADSRLQTFLAEAYSTQGRHAEALETAWERFADHLGLDTYRALKPYAEAVNEWPRRRERALGLLRERARETRGEARHRGYGRPALGRHSVLVEIMLWEGDVEAAWREAQEGGCDESLWIELAERRKHSHPEDTLHIYRERIEPTIARKTKRDYAEAVGLIEEVGGILRELGREDELKTLVAEIRSAHARKRNLIALLDKIRLDAAQVETG